jgi:hypothetical protein
MKTTIFEGYSLSYSNGNGFGNGNGWGYGRGDGNGHGYGYGCGGGNGDGSGYGWGYGDGNGNSDGNYDGNGDGYGNGDGIVIFLSPVFAYHIISGERPHAGKDIDTEHAYNAGENIKLCKHGLHASLKLEDARDYVSGTETKVQCSGRAMLSRKKLVCEHREVVRVL